MDTQELINELSELTLSNMKEAQEFLALSKEKLNRQPSSGSWSVLACIEHLNRYGDFYIPEIKSRLEKSRTKPSETFQPGLLGNYFAKSMLPKEKLNTMRTFQAMNPLDSLLDKQVLDRFIVQQREILMLLDKARAVDLAKIKTSISISKWIKLRLGDTFRVVVYHNLRHIVQAKKALTLISPS
ncbi:DinB family protein [Sphingobacterium bambusae]|uniref:DinB family protein n=1 Tax=Sphingobacterium bambusae TaxID=662858 RepID=A0ABW6BIZ5_9SPHI|nr:DinB family protein [Sphingobacterium bambusae]WPL50964.1 DinB family protein [Sphingobacterium bambusae]